MKLLVVPRKLKGTRLVMLCVSGVTSLVILGLVAHGIVVGNFWEASICSMFGVVPIGDFIANVVCE